MSKGSSKGPGILTIIILVILAVNILRRLGSGSGNVITIGKNMFNMFLGGMIAVVVVVLIIAALLIWVVHKDDKKVAKAKQELANGKLDQLSTVLRSYSKLNGIGAMAANAARQMESLDMTAPALRQLIDAKFEKGSLTHNRYSVPVEAGIETVVGNALQLAAQMQNFNAQEFTTLHRAIESGTYRKDMIDDDVQIQRYKIYLTNLEDMEKIVSANEKLLLTLDQCKIELSKLQSAAIDQRGEQLLSEIQELADTAKYYQKELAK